MATFNEVLADAIADMMEHGYDSAERVAYWQAELKRTAEAMMMSDQELEAMLREALFTIYTREIDRGVILRRHPGLDHFTLQRVKPHLRQELDRRILAAADLIRLNKKEAVEQTLRRFTGWSTSIPKGGPAETSKREEKARISKSLKQLPFERRRLLTDQGHKLVSSLNDIIATDGGAIAAIWHSHWREINYDYRVDHKDRDLLFYAVRGSWALTQGLMKPSGVGYVDGITRPAEEPYCFPGDSIVERAHGVSVGYRRWYSGDLTEIVTTSGKTIRATRNHPILSPNGWVSIGFLNEGDEIFEVGDEFVNLTKLHKDKTQPTFAQVFQACREAGVSEMRRGSLEQFHGDGTDGDIDVVSTHRLLTFGAKAGVRERLQKLMFAMSDGCRLAVSALDTFVGGCFRSSSGLAGRLGQSTSAALAFSGHANSVGGGGVSHGETVAFQSFDHRAPRYVETEGEREAALARAIGVRKVRVLSVRQRPFSGHLYNLETEDGWYVTGGVIAHNCRCYYQYVYNLGQLPRDMLTKKGERQLAEARAKRAARV